MTGNSVNDIAVDKQDAAGDKIVVVYAKISDTYAVYRTRERVIVQYADDPALGREQRQALLLLNPLKGQINGLIDGWRVSKTPDQRAKAKLFDRRVADALVVGLQGDQAHALELLNEVKEDILEERRSIARFSYLLVAFAVTIAILSILGVLWWAAQDRFSTLGSALWQASGVGTVGALFSIALGIRARSLGTDLQSRDNSIDAGLRILIGALSAAVMVCLLHGQLVNINLGKGTGDLLNNTEMLLVISFAAGFSERLVGDLLNRTALAPAANSAAERLSGTTPRLAADGPVDERNPLGKAASVPEEVPAPVDLVPEVVEDEGDGCLVNHPLAHGEMTDDRELPEATGGVEQAVA